MADPAVKMRINRRAFQQYYDIALEEQGSRRRIASQVGVSHTLVHNILSKQSKTHVNLDTANRFEKFFGAPKGIIFTPEVFGGVGNKQTKAVVA